MAQALSHQASTALRLLGAEIAQGRRERRWSSASLARRAGVSETTVRKVERGEPGVAVGTVLEMAALTGVPLFSADPRELDLGLQRSRDRLALLPKRVRARELPAMDDDF
jgi:transcriptional regulator with XRE-family HTH domain